MFNDTAWKRIENRVKRGEAKLEAMLKMTQVAREELTAAAAAKKQLQLPTRSRQSNAFNLEEDLYILEWIVAQVKVSNDWSCPPLLVRFLGDISAVLFSC